MMKVVQQPYLTLAASSLMVSQILDKLKYHVQSQQEQAYQQGNEQSKQGFGRFQKGCSYKIKNNGIIIYIIECTNKDYCGENECVMEQTRAIARKDDIHRHANKGRDVCFFN